MMRAVGASVVLAVLGVVSPARADDTPAPAPKKSDERAAFAEKGGYLRLQGKMLVGTGLRFNNPYRLPTALGSDAESVSRSAFYLDSGLAALFGSPTGFQHGAELGLSFALEGVRQLVLVPSYVVSRQKGPFQAQLRVGTPIVLTPSTTVGGELALSGTYYLRAAVGLRAELVGDVFYGAGTLERSVPAYPMLSIALGIVVAWESLP